MSTLTKQQQVEHAKLAVDVYLDREKRAEGTSEWEIYNPDKQGDKESSGLTAEAYKSTCGTNEIVFAIGGTNDADDILPDASLVLGVVDQQFKDALRYVAETMEVEKRAEAEMDEAGVPYTAPSYSVTGHSLGGAQAQLIAYVFDIPGVSLDSPGVSRVIEDQAFKDYVKELKTEFGADIIKPKLPTDESFTNYTEDGSIISSSLTGKRFGEEIETDHTSDLLSIAGGAFAFLASNPITLAAALAVLAINQGDNHSAERMLQQLVDDYGDDMCTPPAEGTTDNEEDQHTTTEKYQTDEYTIQAGDTLSEIAADYPHLNYQDLADYNNIDNPDYIQAGQVIRIPTLEQLEAFRTEDNTSAEEPTQQSAITLEAGESLFSLAQEIGQALGFSADQIEQLGADLIAANQDFTDPTNSYAADDIERFTQMPIGHPVQLPDTLDVSALPEALQARITTTTSVAEAEPLPTSNDTGETQVSFHDWLENHEDEDIQALAIHINDDDEIAVQVASSSPETDAEALAIIEQLNQLKAEYTQEQAQAASVAESEQLSSELDDILTDIDAGVVGATEDLNDWMHTAGTDDITLNLDKLTGSLSLEQLEDLNLSATYQEITDFEQINNTQELLNDFASQYPDNPHIQAFNTQAQQLATEYKDNIDEFNHQLDTLKDQYHSLDETIGQAVTDAKHTAAYLANPTQALDDIQSTINQSLDNYQQHIHNINEQITEAQAYINGGYEQDIQAAQAFIDGGWQQELENYQHTIDEYLALAEDYQDRVEDIPQQLTEAYQQAQAFIDGGWEQELDQAKALLAGGYEQLIDEAQAFVGGGWRGALRNEIKDEINDRLRDELSLDTDIPGVSENGHMAINTQVLDVIVDSDIDGVELTVAAGTTTGKQDEWIDIAVDFTQRDDDGSEVAALTIHGVPAGGQLSAGRDLGDGVWSVDASDMEGLQFLPPFGAYGDFNLSSFPRRSVGTRIK